VEKEKTLDSLLHIVSYCECRIGPANFAALGSSSGLPRSQSWKAPVGNIGRFADSRVLLAALSLLLQALGPAFVLFFFLLLEAIEIITLIYCCSPSSFAPSDASCYAGIEYVQDAVDKYLQITGIQGGVKQ
jgi:hypothetical protein